jgi:uncharacterized lipoprotein YajG
MFYNKIQKGSFIMKKSRIALLSMLLAVATLIGSLAGCNDQTTTPKETSSTKIELPSETESVTTKDTETESTPSTVTDTETVSSTENESNTEKETEGSEQ